MANITTTTAAVHIGEVWPGEVISAEEFKTVIAAKVDRAWKFIGKGDVYHVPRVGNLTTASKAASTAWTPEALTDTEQTLTVNVHEVAGFQIEDIVETLNNVDTRKLYQQKIGYSLARAVDVNLAALAQNFSQSKGTLGSELIYDDMVEAWKLIAQAGIDANDECCWILSPGAVAGLLKQDAIINAMYRTDGKRALETATVGTILAAPVVQSNLTRAPSAGQSESFLIHRKGVALMMAMEPKIVTEYLAKELSWVVGGHQIYGYTEVNRYTETPGSTTLTDDWLVLLNTIA
jgi:hypothetical protein